MDGVYLLTGGTLPQYNSRRSWIAEFTACNGLGLGKLETFFTLNLDVSSSFV